MRRRHLFLLIAIVALLLMVVSVGALTDAGTVEGHPDLEVTAPENWFEPGEDGVLELYITNDGQIVADNESHPGEALDRATEARATSVEITETWSAPIDVRTGEQSVGTIEDGETVGPIPFDILVEEDAEPGEYNIEVTVEYTDAQTVEYGYDSEGELRFDESTETVTETHTVEVEVLSEAHFSVDELDHDVGIGDEGDLSLSLINDGEEDITDAEVTLIAGDQDMSLGAGASSSDAYIGNWDADETIDLDFWAGLAEEAAERPYPLEVVIEFEDGDGESQQQTVMTSLTPLDRQLFDIETIDHDVMIDDQGELTIEIENRGPHDAYNTVVTVETTEGAIEFNPDGPGTPTSEAFIGNLSVDESTTATYAIGTTSDALERPYPLAVTVAYEDADGNEMSTRTETIELTPYPEQLFEITPLDHTLAIDDEGQLTIDVHNQGPIDAHSATVVFESTDPVLQFNPAAGGTPTATVGIDDLAVDEETTASVVVDVSGDAIEEAYPIDVTVVYENEDGEEMTERTQQIVVEPMEEQTFDIADIRHSVAIEDDGIIELQLTNEGPYDAKDAVITLESLDTAIQVGSATDEPLFIEGFEIDPDDLGSISSEAYVGDWAVGETKTVRFIAAATEDAIEKAYPLEATVSFDDPDGTDRTPRTRTVEFEPHAAQTFAIEDIESELRVGEDGEVRGTITNTGDQAISGVVLRYDDDLQNVAPREEQYALGQLDPGESTDFRFRLGVTDEAEAGPRIVEFTVRYRNVQDDVRLSDSIDLDIEIDPRRYRLGVEVVNSSIPAGETGTVTLEVTNHDDQTLRNIRAKLFTNDPIDTPDADAFIPELAPGESATVPYEIDVSDGATPRTYPVSIDFRFDDERNETKMTRTQNVPIEVADADEPLVPMWGWVLLIAALLVAIVVGWRRYGGDIELSGIFDAGGGGETPSGEAGDGSASAGYTGERESSQDSQDR